jgi:hypothetical protein
MRAPIHHVSGIKGGVGKTIYTIGHADHYQRRQRPLILIDGDIKTPDAFRCFEHEEEAGVRAVAINLETRKGWAEVVSLADENPESAVIINPAAGSGESTIKYGGVLRDYAVEAERPFSTVWMMNTQRMCCELLCEYIEQLSDVSVHVGLNRFYAESTGEEFDEYIGSAVRQRVLQQGGREFEFPTLSGHLTKELQKEGGQSLRKIYRAARKGDQLLIDGWRRTVDRAVSGIAG